MSKLDRMSDNIFGAALIAAGFIMLLHMLEPRHAHGEGGSCANNTCKPIKYYWNCAYVEDPPPRHVLGGFAQEVESCFTCTNPGTKPTSGRCDGGTADTCKDSGMPQGLAPTDVGKLCDCQPNWDNIGGQVEASGMYSGTYTHDSNLNIFTCKKPS
jgi:hypothetical protein